MRILLLQAYLGIPGLNHSDMLAPVASFVSGRSQDTFILSRMSLIVLLLVSR